MLTAPAPLAPTSFVRRWWPALVCLAVLAVLVAGAPLADEDSLGDLARSAGGAVHVSLRLRWAFMLPLAVCAALHYWCAAVALQAAAGCRVPLRQRVLAQLAASTANRVTPAGLGGAAVNVRFLSRSTALGVPAATSAVAVLAAAGSVSDLALLGVLVALAWALGERLPSAELAALRHRLASLLGTTGLVTVALLVIAAVLVGLITAARRRHRATDDARWSRLGRVLHDVHTRLLLMRHRPAAFARLLAASAGTTLLMGVGLAVAVAAVPYPAVRVAPLLIVVSYMLGAAAGSVAPAPGAFGVTEAGLVAALTFSQVPARHALAAVLVFRLVTFWLPALIGIAAAKVLRSRRLL